MFELLRKRSRQQRQVAALYRCIVEQARRPAFFTDAGVPDTVEGRFELIALHAFLVMRRLADGGAGMADFNQRLFDFMFADIDRSLRELGVGDLGVGKQVKDMAQHFYGRVAAYEAGLAAADPAVLRDALDRNLFGSTLPDPIAVARMAAYLRQEADRLDGVPLTGLLAGEVAFGVLPAEEQ
jgi:cytochrome b pre-mRNA-processing protein 3